MADDGDDNFDDFGDVDEEEMRLVASHAERLNNPNIDATANHNSKRRRLNDPRRDWSDSIDQFGADSAYNLTDFPQEDNEIPRRPTALQQPSEVCCGEGDVLQSSSQDFLESSTRYTSSPALPSRSQRVIRPQTSLRQTTLFGATIRPPEADSSVALRRNWPLANKDEPPTHHALNQEALRTWVYPINLGTIREYQYSIVHQGLYHNLLVALPTGLGKTFIAATIMLNWFRWTVNAQIVFVAPTKPLVSQQVQACFGIAGIPRSQTTLLTGATPPGVRAEEWLDKRVFFMTPQTLINDLKTGCCDPKRIVLVVVDEAHRATGGYAYVEVINFIQRFNTSFRVLALTATPGATVEAVQQVIDGLNISKVAIRTEESIDIRQYVHTRKTETVLFDYSDEMIMLMDLFSKAMQPVLDKLNQQNAYWAKDPMTLTAFGLTEARQKWSNSPAGRNASFGLKGMVNTIFTVLASLAHATELLKYHGIGPFYRFILRFRTETQSGEKGSKYRKQVIESPHFQKMMTRVQAWVNDASFVGHPKLDHLRSVVLNHFLDAEEGRGAAHGASPSSTRVMVFVHYRDSAEEVARVLRRNEPIIKPHVFVGQANSKGSEGMDQKKQQDIIEKFKDGTYNTIIATSIGEEGLDIGEVDLIICYDSSSSPIRMLQRMGRTGRKRAGNIVLLLVRGKEENSFIRAKDNYEKMQQMMATGARFSFHEDKSPRIVPHYYQPVVDKRLIEIPIENSQRDLPEPRKRAKPPKRPLKKFHMPDGVRTGFTVASRLRDVGSDGCSEDDEEGSAANDGHERLARRVRMLSPEPEPIPSLDDVLLSSVEEKDLDRRYQHLCGKDGVHMVTMPAMAGTNERQRSLRRTKHVAHGRTTKKVVTMLNAIHSIDDNGLELLNRSLHPEDTKLVLNMPRSTCPNTAGRTKGNITLHHQFHRNRVGIASVDDESNSRSDLNDFVDDGSLGDEGSISSATTTPPFLDQSEKRFSISPRGTGNSNSDSEEDLPDFTALVKKPPKDATALIAQGILDSCTPPLARRKGRRMAVEDSSDDD